MEKFRFLTVSKTKPADTVIKIPMSIKKIMIALILLQFVIGAAAADPGKNLYTGQILFSEGALAGAMNRFNVVMEAYPDSKANQNMMQLSEELTATENKVAFSRQAFNDQVMAYNTYRQSFPPVGVAGIFGHSTDASLLEFEDSDQIQEAPKVSF